MDENGTADANVMYRQAAALHAQRRFEAAEQAYRAVLLEQPDHVEALHGLGVLCLQSGRAEPAVDTLRRAVSAGGTTVVRNNLGVALCAAGRLAEAADLYREIAALDPNAVSPLFNLGQVLNQLQEYEEAATVLTKALALAPHDGRLHHQFAVALAGCLRTDKAMAHFERAAALAPGRADLFCDWAALLLKCEQPSRAADCYRRALASSSGSPVALCGLGEALGQLQRHEDAVACFRQAVAVAPRFAVAHYNCGTALTYLGRMAEAEEAFRRAAELEPDHPAYRGALIAMHKTAANGADLQALEAMEADGSHLGERERMELQFTLAKAYDDLGEPARAFAALQRGNAEKRRLEPYDPQEDLDRFRAIAAAFTAEVLKAHAGAGDPSDVPVFVVGMPRSGTSLVEQILASHPSVFGAGEQGLLPELIISGKAGGDFPASVATLDGEAWRAVGAAYVRKVQAMAPQAARITDKLPFNFQLIGLIRLAMPNARIVHVMRDPMDTALSCYFSLFANGLAFTDDLADLGRYYRGYDALMTHWRRVLPPEAMLEVQYETLVADFDAQARRLIAYCGLDWDDHCLRFHETVRPVMTASTLQVRRPLYRSSVGRSGAYAEWLEPLRRALAGEG